MDELGDRATSRLLRNAFRLHAQPGARPATIAEIADASQLDADLVLHWYGDVETLCRLAVTARVAALAAPLSWTPPPGIGLGDAVRRHGELSAALFASEDYRRLAFLVMRDGAANPWLVRQHELGVVGAVEDGLARTVARARPGSALLASAARAFSRRLQNELALPMLLPRRKGPTRREIRDLVVEVADQALRSVYSTRAVTRALEQFSHPPPGRSKTAARTLRTAAVPVAY